MAASPRLTPGHGVSVQRDRQLRNRALIRIWLYVVLISWLPGSRRRCNTRLTDSGLSITEWKPIHGVIPPLSASDGGGVREIPADPAISAAQQGHEPRGVQAHLLVGMGAPVSRARRRLRLRAAARLLLAHRPAGAPAEAAQLFGILALGGLQGAVGWWMVASGLVERVDVSQYRLATHLTLACLIFAAIMIVARGLGAAFRSSGRPPDPAICRLVSCSRLHPDLSRRFGGGPRRRPFLQYLAADGRRRGAGRSLGHQPIWLNLFENPKIVQFVHRCGAYFLLIVAIWH